MKLVWYPLKTREAENPPITCYGDCITTQINSFYIISKLEAKKSAYSQTFFCVEITKNVNEATIRKADSFWAFNDPPDFYIHPTLVTQKHLYDMHNFLYRSSIEECCNYFMHNSNVLGGIGLYPPPNLSIPISFTTPPCSRSALKISAYIRAISFDGRSEEIPDVNIAEVELVLKEKFPEQFQYLSSMILSRLAKVPVISERIMREILQEIYENYDSSFPITNLRYFIKSYCYFCRNGAFYKTWVRFGNDLRKNSENYKYQRISKYRLNTNYEFLYEDPECLEIIEKKRTMYISEKYDFYDGFFTEEIILFLKDYYSKKHIEKILEQNLDVDYYLKNH